MSKFISAAEAAAHVKDGATVMIGGFLAVGSPLKIIDALAASGVKNLTLIFRKRFHNAANVAGDLVVDKKIFNGFFRKFASVEEVGLLVVGGYNRVCAVLAEEVNHQVVGYAGYPRGKFS